MQEIDLIQDLAVLLLAAGTAALLCRRAGLSTIVGYLVAGVLIGPYTPPFSLVTDETRVEALSQVGLVFLMFAIGLDLGLSKFARLGASILFATVLGAVGVLVLTQVVGSIAGWTTLQATFIAAMFMVSSSAVIAKVVHELKLAHERASQTALAVTVLEDVVAVAMLTILASQARMIPDDASGVGRVFVGLGAFVVLLMVAGLLLLPRITRRLEARADPETQTVVLGGLLFALAMAAAKAGYSIALGAFLFGAVVAEFPQKPGVETSFRGLRDVFSSVFFVSIGMMIDLRSLADEWPMVIALTGFALVARPIACGVGLVLAGTPPAEARNASLLLTPLGEFTFIIAQLGVSTAILPPKYAPIAVGASILTILATPKVARHRAALLRAASVVEPGWLKRGLDAYHAWFVRLRDHGPRRPLWGLLRPRLGQLALELLFISGVLMFAEVLIDAFTMVPYVRALEPATVGYVFWSIIAAILLAPLVAIWRNSSALAMLVAEAWENQCLPRLLIERTLRALVALALAAWLVLLLPHAPFARWGWLAIGAGGAIVMTMFWRRLVFWHSHWQVSMREVLADRPAEIRDVRAAIRTELGKSLQAWNAVLGEAALPLGSANAGKSLAALAMPTRFGCAVIEVERNGHVIHAPTGDFTLYPGDRVLLAGPARGIDAARAMLEANARGVRGEGDFSGVVLDTAPVENEQVGRSLRELNLATRAGVRVVGIERDGRRIITPAGAVRLGPGDSLLIAGTLEAIRRFKTGRALSGTHTPDAGTAPESSFDHA